MNVTVTPAPFPRRKLFLDIELRDYPEQREKEFARNYFMSIKKVTEDLSVRVLKFNKIFERVRKSTLKKR